MTNRIFEQGNTPEMDKYLGYVKCSDCDRVTAWPTCTMCQVAYIKANRK
jgi:hypothetical protein